MLQAHLSFAQAKAKAFPFLMYAGCVSPWICPIGVQIVSWPSFVPLWLSSRKIFGRRCKSQQRVMSFFDGWMQATRQKKYPHLSRGVPG